MKREKTLIVAGVLIVLIFTTIFILLRNPSSSQELGTHVVVHAASAPIDGFTRANGPRPFSFPEDHGAHPDFQTEWWYYTGNLMTSEGRRFGYQLTFFRRALLPPDQIPSRASQWATTQVYMAHFGLTDVQQNEHQGFEKLARQAAGLAGASTSPFTVWLENWYVQETQSGKYRLYAEQDGLTIDLELMDDKGPVLQGNQGYSQKGPDPGNASYYYSLTRLDTKGEVAIQNQPYSVHGTSWMDHEYSTSALSEDQIGWDWFSIQLDNNYELMLFQIRRASGSIDPYSSGTLIRPDGSTKRLQKDDFQLEVTENWKSPRSGATYPSGWIIKLPSENMQLTIKPLVKDQEMNLAYDYWEGAVEINGSISDDLLAGFGYVELTGYADEFAGDF